MMPLTGSDAGAARSFTGPIKKSGRGPDAGLTAMRDAARDARAMTSIEQPIIIGGLSLALSFSRCGSNSNQEWLEVVRYNKEGLL